MSIEIHPKAILGAANEGIYGLDNEGRVIFVNTAAEQLTGWSREEQLGAIQHELIHHSHKNGQPYALHDCPIYATLRSGTTHRGVETFWTKDGVGLPVSYTSAPLFDEKQGIVGAVVTFSDRSTELLERRYRALVDATSNYVWLCDADGTLKEVDQVWLALSGLSRAQAIGSGWMDAIDSADREEYQRARARAIDAGEAFEHELRIQCADGRLRWFRHNLVPVENGNGILVEWVGAGEDITEQKAHEYQLERQAARDPLTGLFNRREFEQTLAEEMVQTRRLGTPLSLIMLDIDNFKAINDRHGHDTGDEVLESVAGEVGRAIRGTDTLARWGGEEFAILLSGADIKNAARVAESVRTRVAKARFPQAGRITVSLGVAQYKRCDTAESLFKRADEALYEAKESGRDRVVIHS
ncbi:sensor domain-containing diguanylate cyclase [Salinisphaera sp. RV14]|uniref:sensor domain-containing diguanylate cyclase n=1 Tax=unclassified Salinisphaera TaxID=2649847 RepID=UPI003F860BFF